MKGAIFYSLFEFCTCFHECVCEKLNKQINFTILGVDFGTKKLGFATIDAINRVAFPKDVLLGKWVDLDACIDAIMNIITTYKANAIVIGYPLKNDGSLNENCIRVEYIAKKINEHFQLQGMIVPILLFDERFSTQAVYALERHCDRKNKNLSKKKKIKNDYDDNKSACIMLNEIIRVIDNQNKV